jgi:hypothetical protein
LYRVLAAAVASTHFLFILFVLAGGVLVLRWPRLAWVHLPAVVWGAVVEVMGWDCPLTPLENRLRQLGGLTSYDGDFVARYLLPVIYPEGLTLTVQRILGAVVIVVNLVVYALVIRKHQAG